MAFRFPSHLLQAPQVAVVSYSTGSSSYPSVSSQSLQCGLCGKHGHSGAQHRCAKCGDLGHRTRDCFRSSQSSHTTYAPTAQIVPFAPVVQVVHRPHHHPHHCKLAGCRHPHTHSTRDHRCGTCGGRGHRSSLCPCPTALQMMGRAIGPVYAVVYGEMGAVWYVRRDAVSCTPVAHYEQYGAFPVAFLRGYRDVRTGHLVM